MAHRPARRARAALTGLRRQAPGLVVHSRTGPSDRAIAGRSALHPAAAALALLAATQAPTSAPAVPMAPATRPAAGASAARSPEAVATPAAEAPLPPGWSERRSKEGGFAALMPCEPGPLGEPVDLPSDKGSLRMVVWGCEVAKGAGYGVVVMEFPPGASSELSVDALDQMAE